MRTNRDFLVLATFGWRLCLGCNLEEIPLLLPPLCIPRLWCPDFSAFPHLSPSSPIAIRTNASPAPKISSIRRGDVLS